MIIRNIVESGRTLENAFAAVDDLGNCLGRCLIKPAVLEQLIPERPVNIEISAEGREEVRLQLLAAAMARGMQIARESHANARIYAQCRPGNDLMMERLKSLGFMDNDALMRMRQRVRPGLMSRPIPEGCVFVEDRLDEAIERKYFLERTKQLFRREDAEQWLDEASHRPMFRRFLLTSRNGLAGEVLCWAENGEGVIGQIYTAPGWRRKGVATYLMERVRLYFCDQGIRESVIDVRWLMQPVLKMVSSLGYRRSETLWRLPGIDINADGDQ